MSRIIKLTEKDLNQIVNKVLKEQYNWMSTGVPVAKANTPTSKPKENINPKNLKKGAGGKKHPEQQQDVIDLQKKLIALSLLKDKTGDLLKTPTGYFGDLTQAALDSYNKGRLSSGAAAMAPSATTSVSAQQTSSAEPSWFDKAKDFCLSPVRRVKDLANFVTEKITSFVLEPHLRAFLFFLTGRTAPLTERFFKPEELKEIKNRIDSVYPKDKKCKQNKTCNISFYSDTDWAKLKQGQETQVNVPLAKSIGFTLGNASVTDEGSYYLVKDIYDFNNYQKNPNAYSFKEAPDTIKKAIDKITCGNYVQGIEELASFKQALGYKGIPVEIKIPKNV